MSIQPAPEGFDADNAPNFEEVRVHGFSLTILANDCRWRSNLLSKVKCSQRS
jgi:hypothetical protein